MIEEWRPVALDGFGELYEVSSHGRLRTSTADPRGLYPIGYILKPRVSNGYHRHKLSCDGQPRFLFAHRLVAMTFIGPRPSSRHAIAHNDGNKLNNSVTNLRWATAAENAHDKYRHGTIAYGDRNGSRRHPERLKRGDENGSRLYPERLCRGSAVSVSKLSADAVSQIRQRFDSYGLTKAALAREYGVSEYTIYAIVTRRTWRHVS